jgi:hypothetical protein
MAVDGFARGPLGCIQVDEEPLIHLEYGLQEADMDCGEFRVCDRGMSFKSQWPIQVGMELNVELSVFDPHDVEDVPETWETSGIVVESSMIPESNGCYRISLLFLD